jgi:hypothetical protein
MGVEEREEVQARGIRNILNIFPNLKKVSPIQKQEAPGTSSRIDQNITSPWHIII